MSNLHPKACLLERAEGGHKAFCVHTPTTFQYNTEAKQDVKILDILLDPKIVDILLEATALGGKEQGLSISSLIRSTVLQLIRPSKWEWKVNCNLLSVVTIFGRITNQVTREFDGGRIRHIDTLWGGHNDV
jgi:hypothetical protein